MEPGWADFLRKRTDYRRGAKERIELSQDRLNRIKNHPVTKRIMYPEYQEAFDYVDSIYSFANVRQAIIYKTSKFLLNEVGYKGIGGFYDTIGRVIVVTDQIEFDDSPNPYLVKAEFTMDEVLCHELIHYASNFKMPLSSRHLEEQIAYGRSVGYLKAKGRSEEFIINKNMMPYLIGAVDRPPILTKVLLKHYDEQLLSTCSEATLELLLEKHQPEVFQLVKKEAANIGARIIREYSGEYSIETKPTTCRKLNIDSEF
jgi:hypothetical protein